MESISDYLHIALRLSCRATIIDMDSHLASFSNNTNSFQLFGKFLCCFCLSLSCRCVPLIPVPVGSDGGDSHFDRVYRVDKTVDKGRPEENGYAQFDDDEDDGSP